MITDYHLIIDQLFSLITSKEALLKDYIDNYLQIWLKSPEEISDFIIKEKVFHFYSCFDLLLEISLQNTFTSLQFSFFYSKLEKAG